MLRKTLILDRKTVQTLITPKQTILAIEKAFESLGKGDVIMPPKIYLHLDRFGGDFRAMPAHIHSLKRSALKWVSVHPGNKKYGIPAVMAVIILSDPRNGYPLCIMDGTHATNMRTGAAGAVAAKYCARKDSAVIGLVGCGQQARTQLLHLMELFTIQRVRIWGHNKAYPVRFKKQFNNAGFPIHIAKTVKECVSGCDIVVTTTPSRKPLVNYSWIKPDAHINAIGADAPGKQELDPVILKKARIVIDSWEQAVHSGEINVAFKNNRLSRKDIYGTIGAIIAGKKRVRKTYRGITVFDSTGLAIQDVAIADLIYREALKKKRGQWIKLI